MCCSSNQAYLDAVLRGDAVSVKRLLQNGSIEVDVPFKVRQSLDVVDHECYYKYTANS